MIKIGLVGQTSLPASGLWHQLIHSREISAETISEQDIAASQDSTASREKIMRADIIILTDLHHDQMDLIRRIIKNDIPVFFLSTDHLDPADLKEISKLGNEAEIPVCCYNPLWFDPVFTRLRDELLDPFLIHFFDGGETKALSSFLSRIHHFLEVSLLLSRGSYLRSDITMYPLDKNSDLAFVEIEYDSGARTQMVLEAAGRKTGTYSFRQHKKIITWKTDKKEVSVLNYTQHNHWKRKKSKYRNISVKDEVKGLISTFNLILSGESPSITIEDRLHTSLIFHEMQEKIRTRKPQD